MPIPNEAVLYLVLKLKGASFPTIKFNSLGEPLLSKTDERVARIRSREEKINLEGGSNEKSYDDHKDKLWIAKG